MHDDGAISHRIGGQTDISIAALAERQHGVVARRQLRALGITERMIELRLDAGRLHRIYAGIYAVGHRVLSQRGHWLAAVLSAGPGAALSYRSAGGLWVIRQSEGVMDVTSPRKLHPRPSIRPHRATLPADEITVVDGIPVTTVPRTILDLAAVLSRRHVERAMNEAEIRWLTDPLSLDVLAARYPRRRGVATIKAILANARLGLDVTRGELEERFQRFVDAYGLPKPELNVELEVDGRRFILDCVWRDRRLIVELDGHATHATRIGFESDRARDRAITVAGWRVIRITWRQLHADADALAADLGALLASRGPRPE